MTVSCKLEMTPLRTDFMTRMRTEYLILCLLVCALRLLVYVPATQPTLRNAFVMRACVSET